MLKKKTNVFQSIKSVTTLFSCFLTFAVFGYHPSTFSAVRFDCSALLEGLSVDHSAVFQLMTFPESSFLRTTDPKLRRAIYKAYQGRDFYSGVNMDFSEMQIDHVIPVALSGPHSYLNYVPTVGRHNNSKRDRFDPVSAIGTLALVRTVYAPRIERELNAVGEAKVRTASPRPTRASKMALEPIGSQIVVEQRFRDRADLILATESIYKYLKPSLTELSSIEINLSAQDWNAILGPNYKQIAMDLVTYGEIDFETIYEDGISVKSGGGRLFPSMTWNSKNNGLEVRMSLKVSDTLARAIGQRSFDDFQKSLRSGLVAIIFPDEAYDQN